MTQNPRQLAFLALRSVHRGAFADVAVDRALNQSDLSASDRRLFTELVYGSVRRQRTLDFLIDQFAKKKLLSNRPIYEQSCIWDFISFFTSAKFQSLPLSTQLLIWQNRMDLQDWQVL